ncbi:MAG: hypothetical protein E7307_07625 [Butyrivibrio sp.]|nr:hypothetical protein [Butyrivibrio sp.]
MKNWFKENGIYYLLVLISAIVFFFPFFAKGFVAGTEIGFHYTRISTLAESLKLGIFPAKLRPMHMKLYGYGVGFFYPDFFIYIPAALVALGLDYEITVKSYLLVSILVGAFATYKCFVKLAGNKAIALFGEILHICALINDDNLFGGHGIPHLFAYMAIPLALCGLLEILEEDSKKGYIKYAVGLVSVVLSHHLIFLTMLLVMIVIVLVHGRQIIKKPSVFGKLMGVSFGGLIFTTAYWLPALEQALKIKLIALYDNAYSLSEHILTLKDLVTVHIGLPLSLLSGAAFAAFFVLLIRNRRVETDVLCLFIVNLILLFLSCSRAFWTSSIGQALNFFQYTQRFVFVFTVTLVMFTVVILREIFACFDVSFIREKKYYPAAVAVFMLLVIIFARNFSRPGFYRLPELSTIELSPEMYAKDYEVSMGEWLPVECEPSECKEPTLSKADDKTTAEGFKSEGAVYYDVWVLLDKKYYDVPYVYYYGYSAYLMDDNGNLVKELDVGEAFDDNGYVRVFMPDGGSGVGHILVTYRKTMVQKISYVISAVATLAIFALFAFTAFKKGKTK